MESVSWLAFTAMSSLVAKGKAQTVRPASTAQTLNYTATAKAGQTLLRLFNQCNLPNSALHFQANRRGSFPARFVRVFIIVVAHSVRGHRSDTTRSTHHNPHFPRQPNR